MKYTRIGCTPEQVALRDELVGILAEHRGPVLAALAQLTDALRPYNAALAHARQLAEKVEADADEAIGERSDAFLETQAGGAAEDFSSAWRQAYLESRAGVVTLAEIKIPALPDQAGLLARLPVEPERARRKSRR